MARKVVGLQIMVVTFLDADPDTSYLKQKGFEDRLAAYQREEWHHVFVRAVATITTASTEGYAMRQRHTVESPGVGGVEDDISKEDMNQLHSEQIAILTEELKALGIEESMILDALTDGEY